MIKASSVSCHYCCLEDAECHRCQQTPVAVTEAKVEKSLANERAPDAGDGDNSSGEIEEGGEYFVHDDDQLGTSDVEEDFEEEDDSIKIGDAVWGLRYRKRLPALVRSLQDIPHERQAVLRTNKPNMFYIEFVGIAKFSVAHKSKLIKMSDTPQDLQWAEGNSNYQFALAMSS